MVRSSLQNSPAHLQLWLFLGWWGWGAGGCQGLCWLSALASQLPRSSGKLWPLHPPSSAMHRSSLSTVVCSCSEDASPKVYQKLKKIREKTLLASSRLNFPDRNPWVLIHFAGSLSVLRSEELNSFGGWGQEQSLCAFPKELFSVFWRLFWKTGLLKTSVVCSYLFLIRFGYVSFFPVSEENVAMWGHQGGPSLVSSAERGSCPQLIRILSAGSGWMPDTK